MGKGKVQFTLIFYLKPNEEVQLDLHTAFCNLHIFVIFSEFAAWKNEREKLTFDFL